MSDQPTAAEMQAEVARLREIIVDRTNCLETMVGCAQGRCVPVQETINRCRKALGWTVE